MSNDELSTPKWDGSDKMSEDIDLKELEQKSFKESIQDGLDILTAGILILMAAGMFLDLLFYIGLMFVITMRNRILESIRKKLTYNRIGQVNLRKHKYDDWQKTFYILFLFTVINTAPVLLLLSSGRPELVILVKWYPAIFGLVFLGPSYYVSSKTGNPRFYLYTIGATILGFLFAFLEFTPVQGWFFYLLIVGGIMVLIGCIGFAKFLRKYPIIVLEESDETEY
ncbi:MAG: hypothetical protein P1Q69_05065 [Candidatus Thorarchaeota archaeon]|nr:hypothetical protein [Candidatus Thorarchaeota archaeon]